MKKLILHSLLFSGCLSLITSCSKQVKTPSKNINHTSLAKTSGSTTTTNNTTQTTSSGGCGHTCGGGSTCSNGGSGGGY